MAIVVGEHCEYRYGEPEVIDYTPSGAVAAGEVVVVEQILGICHRAIAANELGALAIGGAVYEFTGDAAIAFGKPVYWDASEEKATETDTGNKYLGLAVTACSGDDSTFFVARAPSNTVAPGSGG